MRFRGVKVILRDGLKVTDQVRKDMFHAWQDLQLLHATQPGLQYKYMIGGKKSWKVSSLNGVDRIELLGYQDEKKPPKKKPKIRQRTKEFIRPAFEVYSYSEETGYVYVGVVICKGGGFNPPYELFEREEFLPFDYPDEPNDALPEIRKWFQTPTKQGILFRMFEDLIPLGIAEPDWYVISEPVYNGTYTYGYSGTVEGVHIEDEESGNCTGVAWPHWSAQKTRYYDRTYGWGYTLDDDPDPGQYSIICPNELTFNKAGHVLTGDIGFVLSQSGSGSGEYYGGRETYRPWTGGNDCEAYVQMAVDQVEANVAEFGFMNIVGTDDDPCRDYDILFEGVASYFEAGGYARSHNYINAVSQSGIDRGFGSALLENEYAFIGSNTNEVFTTTYSGLGDNTSRNETVEKQYGPAYLIVDGVFMPITPYSESRQAIYYGWGCKYFHVGNSHIGLYHFNLVNPKIDFGDDGDYMFGYASVNADSGESKIITTYFGDQYNEEVPDITDPDGNPVYIYGGNDIRLIKETVTVIEEYI